MSRDDFTSSRVERAEKWALNPLRLNRVKSIDRVGFLPFEGTLSIVISPKKALSKEKKRPIDWQDCELELCEEESKVSPPFVNQEALVEEHPIGIYPISGLPALDLEQLELGFQYGGDTLEEC